MANDTSVRNRERVKTDGWERADSPELMFTRLVMLSAGPTRAVPCSNHNKLSLLLQTYIDHG